MILGMGHFHISSTTSLCRERDLGINGRMVCMSKMGFLSPLHVIVAHRIVKEKASEDMLEYMIQDNPEVASRIDAEEVSCCSLISYLLPT